MLFRSILAGSAIVLLMGVAPAVAQEAKAAKRALVICNGAAQEASFSRTQNSPTSTASTVFVPVLDTTIAAGASGPVGDFDLYVVTFAGEAANTSGGFWEAEAEVSVNGGAFTNINPTGPNTFKGGNKAENNSMTWCARLQATVSTTFRIQWRKTSGGGTANLDDYIINVERSN
jgi:hypothetical protein